MVCARTSVPIHRGIWYMGAKGRVIPGFLDRVLSEEIRDGDTVVDLMSGSGIVSAFCANRYRVIANDVQLYSAVITRSLIEHDPRTKLAFLRSLDPVADLDRSFKANLALLEDVYAAALDAERAFLDEFAAAGGTRDWPVRYRRFLSEPDAVYPVAGTVRGAGLYGYARRLLTEKAIAHRRRDPRARPACLATAYYANVYFGLRQAIQIDSLRAAIDDLNEREPFAAAKRTHYLSALLHVASVCTSGTSHFAQPRHLTKDSELRAMAKRRSADVWRRFVDYVGEIAGTVRSLAHRRGNAVLNGDYLRFIDKQGRFSLMRKPRLVYLDPPYTADHYSRFYHVLEVLARYDYPELDRDGRGNITRGRYPKLDSRFRSGFSRRERVEDEFRRVIEAASRSGAKLVISYASPTGLLLKRYRSESARGDPVRRFESLCRGAYRRVRTLRRAMNHSGQGDSVIPIEELLVVCS